MAFRILRLRKEARRNVKLDEIFQERDKERTGLISYEQLEDIYRIYQVREGILSMPNNVFFWCQNKLSSTVL